MTERTTNLHPNLWANTPPITGPTLGPTIGPSTKKPKNPPRSSGVEISEITPAPIAIVLAEPAACRHRRTMSNQYAEVGTRASPMHDNDRTKRQAIVMGRLPTLSESVPQIIGAGNWSDCYSSRKLFNPHLFLAEACTLPPKQSIHW